MNWIDLLIIVALLIPGFAVGCGLRYISKKSYIFGGMLIVSGAYSTLVFAGFKLMLLWGTL